MLLKSGPCVYDSKYLSQIDRFCERAVKYGCTARFTPTAATFSTPRMQSSMVPTTKTTVHRIVFHRGWEGGGEVRIKNEMS